MASQFKRMHRWNNKKIKDESDNRLTKNDEASSEIINLLLVYTSHATFRIRFNMQTKMNFHKK